MGPKTLGILGGMGPLASLGFLRTIYEYNLAGQAEQDYPNIVLHSLSCAPDRTQALLNDAEQLLADCLTRNLRTLAATGVSRIVICCFTSHSLMKQLPEDVVAKVVSLVDRAAAQLMVRRERSLLLASLGSYRKEVFKSTDDILWAQEYIVEPDEEDKILIQELIYRQLKTGSEVAPVYRAVRELLDKYQVDSFIAGCSEFHLLTRYTKAMNISDILFVDPLFSIAEGLDDVLDG